MDRPGSKSLEEYRCVCCLFDRARFLHTLTRDGEGHRGRFDLWRCSRCGFIQLRPQPDEATLRQYYDAETYYAYRELSSRQLSAPPYAKGGGGYLIRRWVMETAACSGRPHTWRDHVSSVPAAMLRRRLVGGLPTHPPNGPLLDIGCGDGLFLAELKRLGWTVSGIEMDAGAVQAAQRHGLDVRQGTVEALPFSQGSFAVIRMWHVLEHVRDPRVAIANARRLLQPNGELIIGIPNVSSFYRWLFGPRWFGWDLPRHLSHFSPTAIRHLLASQGFRVTSLRSSSVGTGYRSMITTYPRLTHFGLQCALALLDLPMDWIGFGDGLDITAVPANSH